jgi:hypothetical protein
VIDVDDACEMSVETHRADVGGPSGAGGNTAMGVSLALSWNRLSATADGSVLPQSKLEERSDWVSIDLEGGSYEELASSFSRH